MTATAGRPSRRVTVICYVGVVLIWGTTWYAMKASVETVPPILAAGLRFTAAFPFLLVLTLLVPNWKLLPPPGTRWLVGVLTVSYIVVPYAAINYGEQRTSSGLAAIIFASVTVLLVVFSVLARLTRVTWVQWVAIVAGLALLAFLVGSSHASLGVTELRGPIIIFAAAVLHAGSYTLIARYGRDVDVISLEVLPIGLGGALLLIIGGLTEDAAIGEISLRSWIAVGYLAVVASVVGFGLYFYLLQRVSPVPLSFVFIFFPIVAMGLSVPLEGLQLTLPMTLAALGVLVAFAVAKFAGRSIDANAATTPLDAGPISAATMREIADAALAEFPRECCGFVVGGRIRPAQNMADSTLDHSGEAWARTSSTGYALSSADARYLSESLDGPEPVEVVYHSHPNGQAYFSAEDEAFAFSDGLPVFPGVRQLVVGVDENGVAEARLFDLDSGAVVEVHRWSAAELTPERVEVESAAGRDGGR